MYKYFEGYWDVRQINGRWLLWNPRIREVKDPEQVWFIDVEFFKAMEEFSKTHADFEEYAHEIYKLSMEPGNENLSVQQLYDKAKSQNVIKN